MTASASNLFECVVLVVGKVYERNPASQGYVVGKGNSIATGF